MHWQTLQNFQIASNNKVSIITLQCICANGNVVPPAVLFPRVNFNPEHNVGFPDNFYFGFTKNGWIETSQFYAWLTNHFVKYIPPMHPIVMLLDGHSSHIDFYVVEFCAANGILLFCLPPHWSYALQPADRGVFGSFKSNFSKGSDQVYSAISWDFCNQLNIFWDLYKSLWTIIPCWHCKRLL